MKIISFEGIEGVGKSTQISLLKEYLESKKYLVEIYREPGSTTTGEKIRDIFLQDTVEKVDPITEALLLYASRKHLDQNFLREKISQGYIVIADRYSDATVAYQCFGKGLSKDFIDFIHSSSDLLTPDLTFYMDITAEMSRERISNRAMDRMESEPIEFFNKVRKGYLEIVSENPERVISLDANKSIDELKDEITVKTIEKLNAALG